MGRCHLKTEHTLSSLPCDKSLPISFHCSVPVPIAECVDDMVAYSKLNDSIIQLIKVSADPSLREAQELIARLERRELYQLVGETPPIDIELRLFEVRLLLCVHVCACVIVCTCMHCVCSSFAE